jgi:cell division protein FtsW
MLSFGLLANFARHEPQAVCALRSETTRSGSQGVLSRLLRLRPPVPYTSVPYTLAPPRPRIPHPARTGGRPGSRR